MLNLDAGIDNQQYSKLKDFPSVIRNPAQRPKHCNRSKCCGSNSRSLYTACLNETEEYQKAWENRAENDKICICLDTNVICAPDLKESDTGSNSEHNLPAPETKETNILLKLPGWLIDLNFLWSCWKETNPHRPLNCWCSHMWTHCEFYSCVDVFVSIIWIFK